MWRSLFSLASSPTSCWGWTSCTPSSTCTCEWSSSFASLLSQNIYSGITRQIIIIILITMTIITITISSTEGEQRVRRLSSLLFSLAMSLCRFYMMPFMTSRRYKDGCRWWCLFSCYLRIIKPDNPRCLVVVLPRCLEQNEFLAFARK